MAQKMIDDWLIKPEKFFDVSGRVVLVSGAASGLGQAIALGYDALGAKVILADINTDGLEATSSQMSGDRFIVKLDVTNIDSVQKAVKESLNHYGRIDISYNIPGINIRKTTLDITYEEFEKVMKVNYLGVFSCAKEVGKVMMDQKKGSMINMASVFGEIVMARQVAYASTKGAVKQMTRVMAAEWAPYVRVNAMGPGYIETPLIKQIMEDKEWYEKIRRQNPFKRFGKPEEVVGPAIFLGSDASGFITGSLLLVDGGWHWFGGEV